MEDPGYPANRSVLEAIGHETAAGELSSAYSACAHATAGKPARHAQSSYATHPWAAAPIAPISAEYRDDYRPDLLPTREPKMSDFDWLAVPVKLPVDQCLSRDWDYAPRFAAR